MSVGRYIVPRSLVALLTTGLLLASAACGASEGSRPSDAAASPRPRSSEAESSPAPTGATTSKTTDGYKLIAGGFRGSTLCGDYEVEWFNPPLKAKRPADATLVVSGKDGTSVLEDEERVAGQYVALSPTWCGDVLRDGSTLLGHTSYSGGAHCCFTMYVTRLDDSARLLEVDLGNTGGLEPNQLDGAGPLELVGLSDAFAYFDGLAFAVSPFLPLVYSFDGGRYTESTPRFDDHVRKDLGKALEELDSAVAAGDAPRFRTFALWAFGDYVLLGRPAEGLRDVKSRVPRGVDAWLERHADRAVKRINDRYSGAE